MVSQIAVGGMGTVWRADDELLERQVAIKVLRPEFATDEAAHARLAFEARAVAAIDSPGVVRIYDYGHVPGAVQVPYLVMELVEGSPLSEVLRTRGPLSTDVVAGILSEVAGGLAAAHLCGLIHRDIKPGNILIATSGQAKVTDFGIARGESSTDLTLTGTLVGTAKYLAPEQVEGRPATSASDVYALGVVAYEALTGQPPFSGATDVATALMRLRVDPLPLPGTVPVALRELVHQMLALDPSVRPTLDDVSRVVGSVASGATDQLSDTAASTTFVTTPAATRTLPVPPRSRRPRVWWGASAVVIGAILTALSLTAWNGSASNPPDKGSSSPSTNSSASADPTASASSLLPTTGMNSPATSGPATAPQPTGPGKAKGKAK